MNTKTNYTSIKNLIQKTISDSLNSVHISVWKEDIGSCDAFSSMCEEILEELDLTGSVEIVSRYTSYNILINWD